MAFPKRISTPATTSTNRGRRDAWMSEILDEGGRVIVRIGKRPDKAEQRETLIEDGVPFIDNPGFAWAAHYAGVEFHLAARRNTRDFELWDWEQQKDERFED